MNLELLVERADSASDCPDTDTFLTEFWALLGAGEGPPTPQKIVVRFSRDGAGYRAELMMSGWREGYRSIVSPDATCVGLSQATLVALSILLDPNATPTSAAPTASGADQPVAPPAVAPAASAPASSVAPTTPPAPKPGQPSVGPQTALNAGDTSPTQRETGAYTLWFQGAAGVTLHFTDALGLAAEAGILVRSKNYAFSVLAFSTVPDTVERGDGATTLLLFGVHARGCFRGTGVPNPRLALYPCLQGSGGSIRGKATGYDTVTPAGYGPWLALGPAIEVAGHPSETTLLSVTAALPFTLTRKTFVVTGSNGSEPYSTPAWGFWMGLGGALLIL